MKKEKIFVDTGAWFALADRSDGYHSKTVAIFPRILNEFNRLVTTNLVVAESYSLIRRSLGHQAAIILLEKIEASPRIVKMYSDHQLEIMAGEILRKYSDQNFTYTDAVSFALMKQQGIQEAFSFDRHFTVAGFKLIP
ncbi:MAG: PIN domain-containing protein [Pseudomonadota bacterium]